MVTRSSPRLLVLGALSLVSVALVAPPSAQAQSARPAGEWHATGGDHTNTKYSPLDQITAENFTDLEIAWRWTSISTDVTDRLESVRPNGFKTTPLMADGLVYLSTSVGQVAALDAGTGDLVWSYDPRSYERMEFPPASMGWQHRGVAYWQDDQSDDARIFIALHDLRLLALNARTGELYPDFGDAGLVDLSGSLGREVNPVRLTHSSPVAIARDVVVIGSIVQDTNLTLKEASPGHVRGFDARTGETHWRERLGGNFSASPVFADGRIYFQSEEGVTSVVAPGIEYSELATNQLDGAILASMAVANGSLFIRTHDHLYRIGDQRP